MKVVLLVSGGMDSVTALYHAAQDHEIVAALSFDYGSKHNHRELPFAAWHCEKLEVRHQVVNLPIINELFQSDLLRSGGDIPEGHYEADSMKQTVVPVSQWHPALHRCRLCRECRGRRSCHSCPFPGTMQSIPIVGRNSCAQWRRRSRPGPMRI